MTEPEEEYTGSHLDAIEQLVRSEGHVILMARVRDELERQRRGLERPMDAGKTEFCRGQIAALRMVLELPDILRNEIASEIKEKKRGG